MKYFIANILSSFFVLFASVGWSQTINLQVSNVCDFHGLLIISNGPDSSGASPSYGSSGCLGSFNYTHYDSVQVIDKVNHIAAEQISITPNIPKYTFLAGENRINIYRQWFDIMDYCNPVVAPDSFLLVDSIAGIFTQGGKLFVIRNTNATDNVLIFDTSSFAAPPNSLHLDMIPKIIDGSYGSVAVAGTGSNGYTRISVFDVVTSVLTLDTLLGNLSANPSSLQVSDFPDVVFLVSSPGDTASYLHKFTASTQTFQIESIYSGSGVHASVWDNQFFMFQPETDATGNNDDSNVLVYDGTTLQQYSIYNTGRRFYKLINASFGNTFYPFYIFHAIPEDSIHNKILQYNNPGFIFTDSLVLNQNIEFAYTDFRCPTAVESYDDNLVKIVLFPNPASESITIKASGLICGRDYKMDIINPEGRIIYAETIHAKMHLEIPINEFRSGIYFLRIHTRKGIVSKQFIKP